VLRIYFLHSLMSKIILCLPFQASQNIPSTLTLKIHFDIDKLYWIVLKFSKTKICCFKDSKTVLVFALASVDVELFVVLLFFH